MEEERGMPEGLLCLFVSVCGDFDVLSVWESPSMLLGTYLIHLAVERMCVCL